MEVPIKRFDTTLPLPEYKTKKASAMDCTARTNVAIPAQSIGYVPLNFALKPPPGHFVLLVARSSLHKRGLMLANGIGIFDEDFCGDEDEYVAILYNYTDQVVEVVKGDRVTQILILPAEHITLSETEHLGEPTRGGIGSTGI